jgi:NAD(P)H-dependent flavin oxidoreductase YrpB (nitropropane dioxygenase family)
VVAAGQVIGLIDDVPTCAELIERMVADCRQQLLQASRWAASETSFASEHVTEHAA